MGLLKLDWDMEHVCGDFLHAVTLKVGQTAISLTKVAVSAKRIRELDPTGAQVIRNGMDFVWSKKRSSEPPVGAILVDSQNVYWTIWRLYNQYHIETFRAFALNLSIVTAPANQATLLRATYRHGRAGEAKAVWKGFFSGQKTPTSEDTVPARFQPVDETSRIEFGAEWTQESYRVYLESPLPISEAAGGEYRILDSQGHRFRVVRYFDAQRIDRLPIALCNKIVEGPEFFQNPTPGP